MVSINKDKCIGCGLCVELYGGIFKIQSDGKAGVKKDIDISLVKDAIGSCHVSAIDEN